MLRLDFYRVFHRKRLYFLLPVTLICCYLAYAEARRGGAIPENVRYWFPVAGAWSYWPPMLGGTPVLVFNILSCVLVALPSCDLFWEDRKSRLSIPLYQQISKRKIAASHFAVAFCAGFLLVLIPLVAQILCVFAKTPILPISKHYIPSIAGASYMMFPELYVFSPLLYVIFTVVRCSVFGGVVACAALSVNYWLGGAYAGLVVPYFFLTVSEIICGRIIGMFTLKNTSFPNLSSQFPIGYFSMNMATLFELAIWLLFCVGTLLHASRERELL